MTPSSAPGQAPLLVGIALAPSFGRRGESLADARAYEAAGCDSLWLEGGEDPWLAAAALATVTVRVRLVVPVGADELADRALLRRAATLQRLAPGRVALRGAPGDRWDRLRTSLDVPAYCEPAAGTEVPAGACGVVVAGGTERPAGGAAVWLRCGPPAGREEWGRTLEQGRRFGAAGLVVADCPRLLDLVRNPGRVDDRSDLSLAHG